MSCVWDSITTGLKLIRSDHISIQELHKFIKDNNKKTPNVKINGFILTEKEMAENMEHIKSINDIHNGYWCSTSDPLLCLVAELYNINIVHMYGSTILNKFNKVNITYSMDSNITLHFESNNSHFSFVKTEVK